MSPSLGSFQVSNFKRWLLKQFCKGECFVNLSGALAIIGLAILGLLVHLVNNRWRVRTQTLGLLALAAVLEATAALVQAKVPLILNTSGWHVAIGSYLAMIWISELDLRGSLMRVAQQRFQSVAMSLGDAVVSIDEHGSVKFWNRGAEEIFGYRADEIAERPFRNLIGTSDFALPGSREGWPVVSELVGVRSNGEHFPIEVRFSTLEQAGGRLYTVIIRDITERKANEGRILYLAMHDPLTGLANRAQLSQRLATSLERAKRSQESVSVLLIDLDNFKEINDTLGHGAGDRFLRIFARQLRAELR